MAEHESKSPSTDGNAAPNVEITFKVGFLAAAIYLAIGLLWHLMTGDYEVFSWTNPWLYVDTLLWPLWLAGWVILGIIVVIVIIVVCVVSSDAWASHEARQRAKAWEAERRREATPPDASEG